MQFPRDIKPHDGQFVDGKHYFAMRVYFEDTDFSGIVYHANYLRYMERARSDMLRQLDMDQHKAFDSGLRARGHGAKQIDDGGLRLLSTRRDNPHRRISQSRRDRRAPSWRLVRHVERRTYALQYCAAR